MSSLQRQLQEQGVESEALDELVHDAASQKATRTNNDGMSEQLRYLAEAGLSDQEIAEHAGIAFTEHSPTFLLPLPALCGLFCAWRFARLGAGRPFLCTDAGLASNRPSPIIVHLAKCIKSGKIVFRLGKQVQAGETP
jgi:hypothetical protein